MIIFIVTAIVLSILIHERFVERKDNFDCENEEENIKEAMSQEELEHFMRECIGYVEHQEEMKQYKDYLDRIEKSERQDGK